MPFGLGPKDLVLGRKVKNNFLFLLESQDYKSQSLKIQIYFNQSLRDLRSLGRSEGGRRRISKYMKSIFQVNINMAFKSLLEIFSSTSLRRFISGPLSRSTTWNLYKKYSRQELCSCRVLRSKPGLSLKVNI